MVEIKNGDEVYVLLTRHGCEDPECCDSKLEPYAVFLNKPKAEIEGRSQKADAGEGQFDWRVDPVRVRI